MILTVFRSRLRPGALGAYQPLAREMSELAHASAGFLDEVHFESPDGERVTIVRFADRSSHDAWASHARHREAQHRGREEFYESYDITVAEVVHERHFSLGGGALFGEGA